MAESIEVPPRLEQLRGGGGLDAHDGRGRGDAATEGAGLGRAADCGGVGVQPADGAALSGGRGVGPAIAGRDARRPWTGS